MLRIAPRASVHAGSEVYIVEQILGYVSALAVPIHGPVQGQRHCSFGVAVRPDRDSLNLAAVEAHGRRVPLQDAVRAIARGFIGPRSCIGLRAGFEQLVDRRLARGMDQQARVVVPLRRRLKRALFDVTRQLIVGAKGRVHIGLPSDLRRIARVQHS